MVVPMAAGGPAAEHADQPATVLHLRQQRRHSAELGDRVGAWLAGPQMLLELATLAPPQQPSADDPIELGERHRHPGRGQRDGQVGRDGGLSNPALGGDNGQHLHAPPRRFCHKAARPDGGGGGGATSARPARRSKMPCNSVLGGTGAAGVGAAWIV